MDNMKEVIIMGNIMERYYTNSEYTYCYGYIPTGEAKVVTGTRFKEFAEISRSNEIYKKLKLGDLIYLSEDNKNYTIKNISTDTKGNTIYFINKTVDTVDAEDIEKTKAAAQINYDRWVTVVEEYELREKEKEENEKIKAMVEKEVSKMDSWWKSVRRKW